MSFSLPEDCLFDIIKYLRNDFKSLNSCARVNRIWNKCVSPMLWSNPWIIEETIPKDQKRQIQLVDIYVLSLPQQSKNFLQQRRFVLPTLSRPLIYDYARFMRILNISYFEDCVWNWVTNQKVLSVIEFIRKVELVTYH